MVNALTFDVEEYFHAETFARVVDRQDWPTLESRVVGATERILAILAEARTAATFFVLGWVAERQPALVRAIRAGGHEVACHGYAHQMITRLSQAEFAEDVRLGKAAVEAAAGVSVVGYRAPTFSVVRGTLWSLATLADAGFQYDSSIFPIVHDRYGIPDSPRFPHRLKEGLVEFPMTTWRVARVNLPAASGGYLRILPLAVSIAAVAQLNRAGHPAVVNVHPWELDPEQPRLRVDWKKRLRHYHNLDRMEGRLRRLLAETAFDSMGGVIERREEAGRLPTRKLADCLPRAQPRPRPAQRAIEQENRG